MKASLTAPMKRSLSFVTALSACPPNFCEAFSSRYQYHHAFATTTSSIGSSSITTTTTNQCRILSQSLSKHISKQGHVNTRNTATSRTTTTTSIQSQNRSEDPGKCPRDLILDSLDDADRPIAKQTLAWLEDSVIGLNLCPFADRPLQLGNVRVQVVRGSDEVGILAATLSECTMRQDQPGTTLVVCPDLFPDSFEAFLEVYNVLQDDVLVDNELDEDLQVAPFHPCFIFQDAAVGAIENWTNRAPYPILHILREEEVSAAVDALDGDSSKVWQRNIDLLNGLSDELGQDFVVDWIEGGSGTADADSREAVRLYSKRFSKDRSKS